MKITPKVVKDLEDALFEARDLQSKLHWESSRAERKWQDAVSWTEGLEKMLKLARRGRPEDLEKMERMAAKRRKAAR